MAGGYKKRPSGAAGFASQLDDVWAAINALRGSAGLTSAMIGEGGLTIYDPELHTRMFFGEGAMKIWSDFVANPDGFGRLYCDADTGLNVFRFFPPYSDGDGRQNSITIQGRTPANPGNMWLYSDGIIQLNSQDQDGNPVGSIQLVTPELGLYNLPTTSSAANLFLGMVGGVWTVAWVTSSRRYKQDIEDVDIDPADVLALRGRTWRDRYEVDVDPDSEKRFVGFIAEELDEHPTLRQFVDYDDDGQPDAISYDRLSVALVALAKDQEQRIAAQEDRLAKLESRLAALEQA